MIGIVVGECHQNHVDQRRYREHQNADQRQAQEQPHDVGIEQAGNIIGDSIDLPPADLALPGVLAGVHRGHPYHNGHGYHHNGHHAVEQHQHGVVALLHLRNAQGFIEDHALLVGSQRCQVDQIGQSAGDHVVNEGDLHRQVNGALDNLPAHHVGQAPYQEGQLGKNVALFEDGEGGSPDPQSQFQFLHPRNEFSIKKGRRSSLRRPFRRAIFFPITLSAWW